MYFLRTVRRLELVRYLTGLSVPRQTAEGIASHNDDLAALDRYLSQLVAHVDRRTRQLLNSIGAENYDKSVNLLHIELEVFGTFRDEIVERGIARQFPLTDRAVAMSLKGIAEMRGALQ